MRKPAVLVLEDGAKFYGNSIGVNGITVGELIFNTSMTGYQEIITDSSYFGQIIVFTYPNIGNIGTNKLDNESSIFKVCGLVIRDISIISSNFRNTMSLFNYLNRNKIIGITDIDTRKLTRLLRQHGSQNGCIISGNNLNEYYAYKKVNYFPGLTDLNLVNKVSSKKKYTWSKNSLNIFEKSINKKNKLYYHVVVYDYGIKHNIMNMLVNFGCILTVVSANTPVKKVLKILPDGIFLSNGPGNPTPCVNSINIIKELLITEIPLFGICLGYQLLALACGAKIKKMKFGHHGSNHPVKNIITNNVIITTQNHNFTIDKNKLPNILKVTHISLFDNTLQGIHHINKPAFGFQGHPEASPGPHDGSFLFYHFIELINLYYTKKKLTKIKHAEA